MHTRECINDSQASKTVCSKPKCIHRAPSFRSPIIQTMQFRGSYRSASPWGARYNFRQRRREGRILAPLPSPPPAPGLTCLASSSPRIPRQIRHRLVNFPNFPFNSVVDGQLCRSGPSPSLRVHVSNRKCSGVGTAAGNAAKELKQRKDASLGGGGLLWRRNDSGGNDREEACESSSRRSTSSLTFLLTHPRRSCLLDCLIIWSRFIEGLVRSAKIDRV